MLPIDVIATIVSAIVAHLLYLKIQAVRRRRARAKAQAAARRRREFGL